MKKKLTTVFATIIASTIIASAPVIAQEAEADAYVREQIEAEREWAEQRQEFVKKRTAQYDFERKYLSDGD